MADKLTDRINAMQHRMLTRAAHSRKKSIAASKPEPAEEQEEDVAPEPSDEAADEEEAPEEA